MKAKFSITRHQRGGVCNYYPDNVLGFGGKYGCSTIRRKPTNQRLETLISFWTKKVDVILIVFVFLYLRLSAVYSPKYVLFRLKMFFMIKIVMIIISFN